MTSINVEDRREPGEKAHLTGRLVWETENPDRT
jgi:hypothetical protein